MAVAEQILYLEDVGGWSTRPGAAYPEDAPEGIRKDCNAPRYSAGVRLFLGWFLRLRASFPSFPILSEPSSPSKRFPFLLLAWHFARPASVAEPLSRHQRWVLAVAINFNRPSGIDSDPWSSRDASF